MNILNPILSIMQFWTYNWILDLQSYKPADNITFSGFRITVFQSDLLHLFRFSIVITLQDIRSNYSKMWILKIGKISMSLASSLLFINSMLFISYIGITWNSKRKLHSLTFQSVIHIRWNINRWIKKNSISKSNLKFGLDQSSLIFVKNN